MPQKRARLIIGDKEKPGPTVFVKDSSTNIKTELDRQWAKGHYLAVIEGSDYKTIVKDILPTKPRFPVISVKEIKNIKTRKGRQIFGTITLSCGHIKNVEWRFEDGEMFPHHTERLHECEECR